MRNFFGVVFYILTGFIINAMCLVSFITLDDSPGAKMVMLGIYAVLGIIFIAMGAWLYRAHSKVSACGTTILISTSFSLCGILMFALMQATPELSQMEGMDSLSMFSSYFEGFSTIIVFLACGSLLLYKGMKSEPLVTTE